MQSSQPGIRPRILNLDLLRGLIVFLALMQHYAGYLVYWYKGSFQEGRFLDFAPYQVHIDYIGRFLPMDAGSVLLTRIFVPWVSLMYITLACVNLVMRDQLDFKSVYRSKLFMYLSLFILFVFENAVMANSLGQALSLYPIHIWMLILALLASVYRFTGIKGVAVCFALSMLRFVVPMEHWNHAFEGWMQTYLHPEFRYDAPIDLFLPGACMGALLGYTAFHLRSRTSLWIWLATGACLMLGYLISGQSTVIDPLNPFVNEHDAQHFLPMLGILGVQAFLISGALLLTQANLQFTIQPFTWIGMNSLAVFFWHRILFVKVWMPARAYLGGMLGVPIQNTTWELIGFAGLTALAVYLLKQSRLGLVMFGQRR